MATLFQREASVDRKWLSARRALLALCMGILGVGVAVSNAGAAPVPIALVQESSQAVLLPSSLTLTLPGAVHAGDDLVASFNNTHDLLTITSISGGGVTWVRANQENDYQVGDSEIWYGLDAAAGPATVTVNLSGSTDQQSPYYALNISEWSGVGGLDRAPAGTAQHEQSTVAVAPAITPTGSGDLFIGVEGSYSSCIASGPPGGGFTSFPIETGLPNQGIQHTGYGYLVATNADTQQYSQPLLAEFPCDWAATAAAFYPQAFPPRVSAESRPALVRRRGGRPSPSRAATSPEPPESSSAPRPPRASPSTATAQFRPSHRRECRERWT